LIVIVIIGILATTMLPKILGAPAKARDAGRVAGLDSLATTMTMYYNDNGAYPTSTGECLVPGAGIGQELITGDYLAKSDFPKDPTSSNTAGGKCGGNNSGYFFYKSLTNKGINDNAYLIMADTEDDAKANANISCVDQSSGKTVDDCIANGIGTATDASAVYIKLGQ
jgi:type II secretory pathway pseudopilin PulG